MLADKSILLVQGHRYGDCFSLGSLLITFPEGFCALLICHDPPEASQGNRDGKRWLYTLRHIPGEQRGKVSHGKQTGRLQMTILHPSLPPAKAEGRKVDHMLLQPVWKDGMSLLQREMCPPGEISA